MNTPAYIEAPAPLSVPQLAARWGCSEGLVRKLIRAGRLQCFRPGALIRIALVEVERFECQPQTMPTASRNSEGALPLSGGRANPLPASADSSPRKIARAPRRKPAGCGANQTKARGQLHAV